MPCCWPPLRCWWRSRRPRRPQRRSPAFTPVRSPPIRRATQPGPGRWPRDGSSRSDFCIAYSVANSSGPSGDDIKQEIVDTPIGFTGNPDGLPQCTDAQFGYTTAPQSDVSCPATSQMGDARADITVATQLAGTQTLTNQTGRVYNLEHTGNEVARLGIVLDPNFAGISQPKVKILVRVIFRPAPDVGLRSIIDDLPRTACTNEIFVSPCGRALSTDAFALRFWGSKSDHASMPVSYAMLGSDCSTDQLTRISTTAYDGSISEASSSYRLTNCDAAPFSPSAEYSTSENRPDVTTETTVKVKFGVYDDPLVSAGAKQTIVTLPQGLSFSGQIASGADGLPLCTPAQFAQTQIEPDSCPAASAVGTVKFTSPVLANPLTGNVYLGSQPTAGALPDVYITAQLGTADDAPRIKLIGHLTIDDQQRIVTTIDDLPQQPVTEFALTFRGGDHAAIVTPQACGETEGAFSATPYSAPQTPVTSTQAYSVSEDCDAAGALDASVSFSGANANAGQHGAFTTTVSRADRSQRLTHAVVNLPPGELATLTGVPECSQEAAAQSACPADTKIGTVTALAGVGPAPYQATGQIYLTSRSDGAVAGISLHVPVQFGDVNLGDLNVPARIEIRDGDLGLRVIADIPERFNGIPLNIRQLDVALDRDGFALNPTNCGALSTTSQLTGSSGSVLDATAGYQVQNCSALAFAPVFDAAVTGNTANKGKPAVQVRIDNAAGSGNLRQTTVTLPAGLGVDLTQISRACAQDTFAAGGCADSAQIGTVAGSLSITDEPLTGGVYLLKPPSGKVLPALGLQFTGRFSGRVTGTTAVESKTGQLVTDFATVPDLPLTRLQLNISGGTSGPVIATSELCAGDTVKFAGSFAAQSGQSVQRTVTTTCGQALGTPKVSGRLSGVRTGKPVVRLGITAPTSPAGATITKVDVTLPSGWVLRSQRGIKPSKYAKVSKLSVAKSASVKRLSARRLRLKMPTGGSSKLVLLTRTGTIRISSKKLRKTKSKQSFKAKVTLSTGVTTTVAFKLTPH
ncbi:MAG: hypothetical protein QM679_01370 [Patulibacter sp.]